MNSMENEALPGESNAERDQDEGSMNNGTIGADSSISDSSEKETQQVSHSGSNAGNAENDAEAKVRADAEDSTNSTGGKSEGSATESI